MQMGKVRNDLLLHPEKYEMTKQKNRQKIKEVSLVVKSVLKRERKAN